MTQSLAQEFDALAKYGALNTEIPKDIAGNLSSKIELRPYQFTSLERWLFYIDRYEGRPSSPHLLFHMATGSGKTVLMATLILDLYRRGYRNFLFFVNSAQIIEKTKENFLNPASAKHLFAPQIRIDDKSVDIRSVDTFDAVNSDSINIHFTTIQGLHTRVQVPRENAVTIEDFRDYKVVMISDEAHHLNAETKKTLNQSDVEVKASWEGTVGEIFGQHPENMLLEFTATVDLSHEAINEKYHDKILYDYSLRQFREDGYSKDIELRQADLPPAERMMQAIVLSQYRRKVAEAHGLHCKPVILMKSRTIAASVENETDFTVMVDGLSGGSLETLRTASEGDRTLTRAFAFIMDERGMGAADFARELQADFSSEKVMNVNNPKDLENRQIELNALEDRDNEVRVIFAVDKLNEGWDVLNLFDIVRLYDTRDGKANKVGKTTMAEAQLIGRGARYFPFTSPDQPDAAREKRKYDSVVDNPLRILEELHYHCSHNPKYIKDIRNALRETGMLDPSDKTVTLRVKDSFKATDFYQSEFVWVNERRQNLREGINALADYKIDRVFTYPTLMTGRVTQAGAFEDAAPQRNKTSEPTKRDFALTAWGEPVLRFALDTNAFFHFQNLNRLFPRLSGIREFMTSNAYLGGVSVAVRGLPDDLDRLTVRQKVEITQYVLRQIEAGIQRAQSDFIGTREFKPIPINTLVVDKQMKVRIEGEAGRSWQKGQTEIPGLDAIDLGAKEWHVYDDSYGTDQEKHFIRFMNDNAERLKTIYQDFYLIRNEKLFKLYAFDDGQAMEPDFVLLMRRADTDKMTILQVFVEPKAGYLQVKDRWKETFLTRIESQAQIRVVFQGRDYAVYGLPFFNDENPIKARFDDAFAVFMNP